MLAAASVAVAVTFMCTAVQINCSPIQGLSPPGPVLEDPELKTVIVAAQGSLRKTFSELESAAESAMASAREVLESATLQANLTVMDSQTPLMDLLKSISGTIVTAVSQARQFGTNVTSCISGQEEAARKVVKETGGTIVGCVTGEIKKAVDLATNMFSVASSAQNLLNYAPREFRGCLPSIIPTVEEIVKIPSCIGTEISAFSTEAMKIAKVLAAYLTEGGRLVEALGSDLKRCSETQIEAGIRKVRQIEHSIVACVERQIRV
ncbi:hypothetical protein Cfor_00794 [Coptotermes formosanus]|uniref:Uncharacterized protein n=1 Tax=Coptotermes formosanus TaxID=36987 RepID=A0A6L2PBM7_COPFO|nr:hypothetical protein Cfor_00794 [Coptotermes formosanus]